jgi:hypothetical protein
VLAKVIIAEVAFPAALTRDEFERQREKLEMCFRIRFVKWIATYFAADGSRAMLVVDASDSETVRNALRSSGTPFEKVWPADQQ